MYDAEQNQQVKMALLRAFGDSKQKSAVRKLMTIARNDPSVEMRKAAVRYLGESKDPEALKFLEDLAEVRAFPHAETASESSSFIITYLAPQQEKLKVSVKTKEA
jgi:HEAT repeat protein